MKKRTLIILILTAVVIAIASVTAYYALKPGGVKAKKIESWPENKYTESVTPPDCGTPDYVLNDKKNGSYAVFFKDITKEESERYIEDLIADGFEETEGADGAIGRTLKKGDVTLNVSISKNILGIYIISEK